MINRARDIVKAMGYDSIDETLDAIGSGDLILVKVDSDQRLRAAEWLQARIAAVRGADEALADTLEDIAGGLEFALELTRYPADADVCEIFTDVTGVFTADPRIVPQARKLHKMAIAHCVPAIQRALDAAGLRLEEALDLMETLGLCLILLPLFFFTDFRAVFLFLGHLCSLPFFYWRSNHQ